MIQRMLTVGWKEAQQLRRDPRLFPILFIAPLFQLILLGYGATLDVKNIALAVWDQNRTAVSRDYLRSFTPNEYFYIRAYVDGYPEAERLIDRGLAHVLLVIPPDFGQRLKGGKSATVQAVLDGTDSNTAQIGLSYINRISETYSSRVRVEAKPAHSGVDTRLRVWYNPELLSKNYMVPGVIAVILIVITSMMTSLAVVKEKEIGTLEQILVTPLRRTELMLGKLLPFAVIGFIDIGVVVLVGMYWFEVPVRGSILLLFALSAVYITTTLGLGLFVSTISHTQNQAQITVFFLMFPMMILSGFAFPIANMPEFFQDLSHLSPVRYFLVIIRGIFLKGSGFDDLWPQVLALAALAAGIFGLSVYRFRRMLE
jgi:ABC-2 type transport system permease protein